VVETETVVCIFLRVIFMLGSPRTSPQSQPRESPSQPMGSLWSQQRRSLDPWIV
jgi:hypothetical protein